jgi:uncharacterized membrane protein YdfJ with MMPL/SSD domain
MKTNTVRSGGTRNLPLTVRAAGWSARHRWIVLGLWFACSFGLFAVNAAAGGQRVLSAEDSRASIGESATGQAVFGAAGSSGARQRFDVVVTGNEGSLDTPSGRSRVASLTAQLAAANVTLGGRAVPVFDAVTDPFTLAAADPALAAVLISPDRATVLVEATVSGAPDEIGAKVAAARPVLERLRAANPDLRILSLNTALLEAELIDYAGHSTGLLLLVSLPLTFLILVLAFRALVAAAIPLVLGLSAIVGGMGIVGAYSQLVGPVSPFAVEFVVLIGLAVAIDYSLFVISRFRTERGAGRDRLAAIEVASATAGRAVFFSGMAVAISMAGLFLLDDPLVASFAVGSIAAVLVSVAGTMTFLPATLAILDRRVDRGALRFLIRPTADGRGFWAGIVRFATKRAVLVTAVTGGLLLAASTPLTSLRLGYSGNDLSIMPAELESVQAATAMSRAWPHGSSLTLDVIVTDASAPETGAAMARLETAALAVTGVEGPARTTLSDDGSVADIAFSLAGSSNDPANAEIVREMRSRVVPAAFAGIAGPEVFVSGDAAYALDYTSFYAGKTAPVVVFVLGLSFLLLLVAFHSIAIPLKAIVLNLLSFGTAFGVLVLVFHGGSGAIDASNPVMIFAILFGLSMDYHVFILTRVNEARDRGLPSNEAVAAGISVTSGTVTSAAAIMVCVFAGFGTIGIANIQQFGLGMAVAVLVDATLVRSLLLPATMRLLGEWNWWLPRFLGWLPRLDIEAEADETTGAA